MVSQISSDPAQVVAGGQPTPGESLRTPVVAIIGRPNVGKSSLFNRILARRQAIVSDVPGTTRDRLLSEVTWAGSKFILVDTGGLETNPEGQIRQMVQEQADMAMADANLIIFLTDAIEGLTTADQEIAQRLRRSSKPVVLVVNKVDNDNREFGASEFYRLGLGDPVLVSAYHNRGIYDLMEQVRSMLPIPLLVEEVDGQGFDPEGVDPQEVRRPAPTRLKLAIVGRTNVGKSMLLNTLLGNNRSIVSDVAGTTRDALDTDFTYQGRDITAIDTAGIRKPGKVERGIEQYSVLRAVNAVDRSDMTLLVTDATQLAAAQDAHISGLAWDLCKGLIVVVNKWDLITDTDRYTKRRAVDLIQQSLHFMPYTPISFVSALHGHGIDSLMRTVLELHRERMRWVPTRELQYLLAEALVDHQPPMVKKNRGQRLRVTRLRQVDVNPPTFVFTVNDPKLIHFSYKRYLENKIRDTFDFSRTHLRLLFREG
ncbi:MAG TPA: ribosome biogenesis GTPase Der [Dehalococcoidia bacterium]|nr:ribosome biogenesis GTPase Der [Dehalococcoidia bacterium]